MCKPTWSAVLTARTTALIPMAASAQGELQLCLCAECFPTYYLDPSTWNNGRGRILAKSSCYGHRLRVVSRYRFVSLWGDKYFCAAVPSDSIRPPTVNELAQRLGLVTPPQGE